MSKEFDRSVRYPIEVHGTILHNTEEEAEYWDTHDLTEFWDEGTPVRLHYNKNKPMQIRLDIQTDRELQELADSQHIPKSTLARALLIKSIEQERKKLAS
jgi:hypothetical protein